MSTITNRKITGIAALLMFLPLWIYSQENSPYSRYGLGNLVPNKNIINRGLGGVAAAFADFQSVNFINPASYSNLRITTFDIGLDIGNRTLKDIQTSEKYSSTNIYISYLQIGVPLISANSKKGFEKHKSWGLNLGLQPITRVSYKIERNTRVIDSVQFLNEGTGGSYFAFAGTGYRIKNFSAGINLGYLFGSKDINNRKNFINDSVVYARSNVQNKAVFGDLFYTLGVQYSILVKKDKENKYNKYLRLGAYGNFKQRINVTTDSVYETFVYDALGGTLKQDSIYENKNVSGKIDYPSSWGLGFIYEKENAFSVGIDFSLSRWGKYRFAGTKDLLADAWMINAGGQLLPGLKEKKKYFSKAIYRAGIYYGRDITSVTGNTPVWGVSLGAGLPVYVARWSTQYTTVNTVFEIGSRGNKNNGVKETFFRIGIGFSLSDLWFRKFKYQ
ncbi:MAG TPA: hypothetical protein VFN30_01920 [Chitinophagaceae bacterium]|nr:hypothetical protein [Chitinophagaceae bacterium]